MKAKKLLLLVLTATIISLIVYAAWPQEPTVLTIESNQQSANVSISLLNGNYSKTGQTPFKAKVDPGFYRVVVSTKTSRKKALVDVKLGTTTRQSFNFKGDQVIKTPTVHSSGALSNPLVVDNTVFGLNPNTDDFQSQLAAKKNSQRDLSLSENSLIMQPPALKVGWLDQKNYTFKDYQDVVNIVIDSKDRLTNKNWLDFATSGADVFLLLKNNQINIFNFIGQSHKKVTLKLSKKTTLTQILVDLKYIYLVGIDRTTSDDSHEFSSSLFVVDKKSFKQVGSLTVGNLVRAQNHDDLLFLLVSDKMVAYDLKKEKMVAELEFDEVVDLVVNPDSKNIYILTTTGEVWSFDQDDQTYFLVSRPPRIDQGGVKSVFQSAVVDSNRILFGVYWYKNDWPLMSTYSTDL